MAAKIWEILVWVWSVLLLGVIQVLKFTGKGDKFLAGRDLSGPEWATLQKSADLAEFVAVFFCSSAGEYEQAVPVIRRIEKCGGLPVIFFFSPSGMRFARIRNEQAAFFLAPPDLIWIWKDIFRALKPFRIFVVRHEFWPSFLTAANASGSELLLINGSPSLKDRQSGLSRLFKSFLVKRFHLLYVVSEQDKRFFCDAFGVSPGKIKVVGDSKYDQVYERSLSKVQAISEFEEKLTGKCGGIRPVSRMIVGSAWPPDYELVLDTLMLMKRKKPHIFSAIETIIALHEPTPEALDTLEKACRSRGLQCIRFSGLPKERSVSSVVLVDSVGQLSELYGCGNLALIGGALHGKIHNVLEPACYGLALAFGPNYKNSGEAVLLVENDCAKVVRLPEDLEEWWVHQVESGHEGGEKVLTHLRRFLGMSDRIMIDLQWEQAVDDR